MPGPRSISVALLLLAGLAACASGTDERRRRGQPRRDGQAGELDAGTGRDGASERPSDAGRTSPMDAGVAADASGAPDAGSDAGGQRDSGRSDAAMRDGGGSDAARRDAAPADGGGTPEACGNELDDDQDGLTDEGCGRTGPVLVIGEGSEAMPFLCLLEEAGWTVRHIPSTAGFDGSGSDGVDLADYPLVVVLDGTEWDAIDQMPASGQEALVRYVERGGGLVTTEWLAWEVAARGRYGTLEPVLPVHYDGDWEHALRVYNVTDTTHPLASDLPASFEVPAHSRSRVQAKTRAMVLVRTGDEPGVVAAPYGDGTVTWFAMAGGHRGFDWLTSEALSLLFVRSADFVAGAAELAPGFDAANAIEACSATY